MTGDWEDEPVIDMGDEPPERPRRRLPEPEKRTEGSSMEHTAPEGASARMQQMLRDNMGAHGDYVDHGAKFFNRVFTERGLFAVLFIGLMGWNLYSQHQNNKTLVGQQAALAKTVDALAYQGDEQDEQLEDMNSTLAEMTRELHDANLVRRYSGAQFQTNPFQNPQEQNNGRTAR